MVTELFSDCARSVLRQSILRVYWASADTLTLPAGTQLLRLPFLECWHAGISSPKYAKLSGSQQIVITGQNRAKLRLCYLQKPSLSRIVVYVRNPWEAHHPHQPGLPVLLLLIAQDQSSRPFSQPFCAKYAVCFHPTSCCAQQFTAFPLRGSGGQKA